MEYFTAAAMMRRDETPFHTRRGTKYRQCAAHLGLRKSRGCLSSIRQSVNPRAQRPLPHTWIVLCISASEVHVMMGAATVQVQRRSSRPVGQISTSSRVVAVTAWLIAVVAMPDTGIRLGSCSSGPFWCWRRGGRRSRAVQDALPLIENRRPRDGSRSVVMFVMMSLMCSAFWGWRATSNVFVARRVRLLERTVQHMLL
jgi:hypothetical protein